MNGTVVVSQLGARMHYAVPRILYQAGRLERLYTDICAGQGWPRCLRLLPQAALPPALRRLRGRIPQGIPPHKIRAFPTIGLASVWARTADPGRAAETRAALRAGSSFSKAVVRHGFGNAKGFYGISGECLEQLQAARELGLSTAVEQIIAPRRIVDRLIDREIERHPEWEGAVEPDPFAQEFAEREEDEWASADIIVCPSPFVRAGIAAMGGPVERCVVVPYGVDSRFSLPPRGRGHAGPLRVLTVGAVGLRKGSPYVLETARRLHGLAEFRLVGPAALPQSIARALSQSLDLAGPVPRSQIAQHYAWADVFFLPSVCEGSATVVYEALSAGLPVVTTPNAGSVIRDGVEGFICPAGDVESLCQRLAALAHDRGMVADMAEAARALSQEYDLAAYARRLLAALATHRPEALYPAQVAV